jgi:hypothetical protein
LVFKPLIGGNKLTFWGLVLIFQEKSSLAMATKPLDLTSKKLGWDRNCPKKATIGQLSMLEKIAVPLRNIKSRNFMVKRKQPYSLIYLLTLVIGLVIAIAPNGQAQTPDSNTPASDPNELKPLNQADSVLSLQGGQRLVEEANAAINAAKYDVAVDKLNQARRIFNQLSNYHLQLANSFSGIDPKVFDSQRQSALNTGQLRDEATYQLALVHRAQNQPELAVPLLIQVIQSQNPTSELGQKSYQQLYEMGFVSTPISAPTPTSATPNNSPPRQ